MRLNSDAEFHRKVLATSGFREESDELSNHGSLDYSNLKGPPTSDHACISGKGSGSLSRSAKDCNLFSHEGFSRYALLRLKVLGVSGNTVDGWAKAPFQATHSIASQELGG